MDPKSQAFLDDILKKNPQELNREERDFLRARRSYLKDSQKDEYREVLKVTEEPIVPVEPEAIPEPQHLQPALDTLTYNQLLTRARTLGYTGRRITRPGLTAYINEHQS